MGDCEALEMDSETLYEMAEWMENENGTESESETTFKALPHHAPSWGYMSSRLGPHLMAAC